jgi:hypothetical protein
MEGGLQSQAYFLGIALYAPQKKNPNEKPARKYNKLLDAFARHGTT